MKGNNLDKQFNDKALPPIQDLSKQYKKTITKDITHQKRTQYSKNFENFGSLNGDINIEENEQIIRKLKKKKTPGNNSITNEIKKCSDDLLLVK